MAPLQPSNDPTVERLRVLDTRLADCISEARNVRRQLLNAQDANHWPDFRILMLLPTPEDTHES